MCLAAYIDDNGDNGTTNDNRANAPLRCSRIEDKQFLPMTCVTRIDNLLKNLSANSSN